jgi:hypothetical protein
LFVSLWLIAFVKGFILSLVLDNALLAVVGIWRGYNICHAFNCCMHNVEHECTIALNFLTTLRYVLCAWLVACYLLYQRHLAKLAALHVLFISLHDSYF